MHIRRLVIGILAVLAIALVMAGVYVAWIFEVVVPRTMSDFAALWNTADALSVHIRSNGTWPTNWKELDPGLRFVNADPSFSEELVVINFDVDIDSPQSGEQWYVRLKSGRMLRSKSERTSEFGNASSSIRKNRATRKQLMPMGQ